MKLYDNIDLYLEVTSIESEKIIKFLDTCISSDIFINTPNIKISFLNQCKDLDITKYKNLLKDRLLVQDVERIPKVIVNDGELVPFVKIRYLAHKISKEHADKDRFNVSLILDDDTYFKNESFEGYSTSANLCYEFKNKVAGIQHSTYVPNTKTLINNSEIIINDKDYYSFNNIEHKRLETGLGIMLPFTTLDLLSEEELNLLGCGEDILYCYKSAQSGMFLITYNERDITKIVYPTGVKWRERARVNKNYDIKWLRKTQGTTQRYLNKQFGFTNNNYHWNPNQFMIKVNDNNSFTLINLPNLTL